MIIEYVCGFLFNSTGDSVILIEKLKPEWQKGNLNGVGGKIEPGEDAIDAMIREFKEETGLDITEWHKIAEISSSDFYVYFYKAVSDKLENAKSVTQEKVAVYSVNNLPYNVLPNVKWLIPLALDDTIQLGKYQVKL